MQTDLENANERENNKYIIHMPSQRTKNNKKKDV